jgi:hypothetical protein
MQVRSGHVQTTVADGKSPIMFRPLAHGGEHMVFTGMRLPLNGDPYDLPYVLKVGLYATSADALRERRKREAALQRHMHERHWFPHQHERIHACPDGEEHLLIMQQPLDLKDSLRLWAGYAELRTSWDAAETTTVTSKNRLPGGLTQLDADDPYVLRYTRVNQALVLDCADEDAPQITRDEFLATQRSKPLSHLVNEARRNSDMRDLLRLYVERAIAYSEDTDEMIDILGDGDNVVFHRPDDKAKWKLMLLDPLHPSKRGLAQLQGSMKRLSLPDAPQGWQQDVMYVLNGLNYVRTMNGLARLLNIRQRLFGWRKGMNEEARRMIDFPLILNRCRECSDEGVAKAASTPGEEGAMTCPREQLQILMRKG